MNAYELELEEDAETKERDSDLVLDPAWSAVVPRPDELQRDLDTTKFIRAWLSFCVGFFAGVFAMHLAWN